MDVRTLVVPVRLEDGTVIYVRASSLGGEEDVMGIENVLPFKEVTQTIEKIATNLANTIKRVKPDKASIEFGIEVAVESGSISALLAKTTGTGNLKITLEWEEEKKKLSKSIVQPS